MPSLERKKISVITTTFNLIKGKRKNVFIEMFKSVHEQTYPNIEHIIIDGASKDGTLEFIEKVNKKYGKKNLVIYSEPDEGITDATIKGFNHASGDYVIIMPSDDYYMCNDALELLANAIEENNVDYACADGWWLFKDIWKADIESFVYRQPFLISAWLVKTSVFKKYGFFNKQYKTLADYELFFRILSKPDITGTEIHKTLTCLRPGGYSSGEDIASKYIADLIPIYRTYFNKDCGLSEYDCKILHFAYPSKDLIFRIRQYETNEILKKSFEKGLTYQRSKIKAKSEPSSEISYYWKNLLDILFFRRQLKKLSKTKSISYTSIPQPYISKRPLYDKEQTGDKKIFLNKPFCTGCSACVASCAKGALSLSQDLDGFYKPVIDMTKCVDCGRCEKVCPLNGLEITNSSTPPLFVFNNNTQNASYSATAGAFQIIARHFIANGGKVAGAAWGKNWRCEHIMVDNEKNLFKLYKSKYVQSFMGNIFQQVKNELKKGTKVLFSGLPCQIAGLYAFVGKKYDNLYTVDLLCNNAPSPKHFSDYLNDKYGIENIDEIEFRHKKEQEKVKENILKIKLKNGKEILSNLWTDKSYCQAFVSRMLVGEHCENCAFAKLPRIADLTIGDIFGAEKIDNRFCGLKSQSVLINSDKGKELFDVIKNSVSELAEIPLQVLINMHPVLKNHWPAHPSRDRLFDLLRRFPFQKACNLIFENKFDVGIVGVPTNPNFGGGLTYLALKWAVEDMGKTCLMISPPGPALIWLPKQITNWKVNPYKDYELLCYHAKEYMREINHRCDIFLVGSDQLFSTHFDRYGIYADMHEFSSLDWVWDSKKKSAYSASFGQDDLICPQDMKNRMRYFLRKFDCFSVRERSAVDLCKREFDINAEFVLDPVFICDKKHWNDLIKIGNKIEGIITYVLDINEEKQHIINDIASSFDLPLHNIADATHKKEQASLMEDWLTAFASAEFIVTDSFHGTCFAIIFNKPFVVIANQARGFARFRILEEFGLKNRLVYSYSDFCDKMPDLIKKPINWTDVNTKMENLKQSSLTYLKKALEPITKEVSEYDILYERLIFDKLQLIQKVEILKQSLSTDKPVQKTIKLPKILVNLMCCFILKKKNRNKFRKKYMK